MPRAIEAADVDVDHLDAALGGTGTSANELEPDWYPFEDGRDDTGELIRDLFDQVDAYLSENSDAVFDTLVWVQGENEADWPGQLGNYLDRLTELYDRFREKYGPDFRFVFVPLSDAAPVLSIPDLPNWSAVQTLQSLFTMMNPEIQVLDPIEIAGRAGLSIDDMYRDYLHYSYPMLDALSAEVLTPWEPDPETDHAIKGNALADEIAGSAGADVIFGYGGTDTLEGGSGGDTLFGGRDHDDLKGMGGDDFLVGERGNDHIQGGRGNDALFGGDGADTLVGNKGDDSIYAGRGDNEILGGNGNDGLFAGDGADMMLGGRGNDTLIGDDGDDLLSGNDGDDTMFGGAGNDTIRGRNDDDRINGGAGDDQLRGDEGADVFEFSLLEDNGVDAIHDFETGVDRIKVLSDGYEPDVVITEGTNSILVEIDDLAFEIRTGNEQTVTLDDIFFV